MQPAKMSIDPKFIELTADVFSRLLLKYSVERGGGVYWSTCIIYVGNSYENKAYGSTLYLV